MSVEALITHVIALIAIIIVVGYLAGAALRRLGQPAVVGQIFAGIALGPSGVGRISGDLEVTLIAAPVVPYLTIVGQIALVLFLFAVGNELDFRVLRQRRAVPMVALMAFVVPMIVGVGSVLAFQPLYLPGDEAVHHVAFVLFIAVAISITAVPVLAGIIAERGAAGSRPGVVAMTSAAIIDAAGWLVLLAIVLLAGASTTGDRPLTVTVALFAGYVLVMIYGARPMLRRWLSRKGAVVGRDVPLIAAIGMISACATSALGLHVIFGAFLAGLIMPRALDGAPDEKLIRPIRETGNLLLPVFFVVAGLPVDIGQLTGQDLGLLGIVCAIAIIGKMCGGFLGARLGGMTRRDATVVGVMLNTRGLTELIVLNVGLQIGIIDRRLYTILVIMALITTALTGPLLGLLHFPRPIERADRGVESTTAEAAKVQRVSRSDPSGKRLGKDRTAERSGDIPNQVDRGHITAVPRGRAGAQMYDRRIHDLGDSVLLSGVQRPEEDHRHQRPDLG